MRGWWFWLAGLGRAPVESGLSAGAVAAAFVLFGYLGAIDRGFREAPVVARADRLIVRHRASILLPLPESHGSQIEAIDGVAAATHATWFGGVYRDPRHYFPQFAVEPRAYRRAYPGLQLSREEAAAWDARRDAAVVGRATAERFRWSVGDRIVLETTLWPRRDGSTSWEFILAGIYDGGDPGVDLTPFLLRYDLLDANRHEEVSRRVGWYIARVADPGRATEVAAAIDRHFANSAHETRSEGELALVRSFVRQIGDVGAVLEAIVATALGMALFLAVNTSNRKTRSRLMDLAVLKAIGFSTPRVALSLWAESSALFGVAAIAGLGVAWWLVSRGDPSGGALPGFAFPPGQWLRGCTLAALLAAAAVLPSVVTVVRTPAATLLRRAP